MQACLMILTIVLIESAELDIFSTVILNLSVAFIILHQSNPKFKILN